MDLEDLEDLEKRVSDLERKSTWWDVASFMAMILVFFGIWELIEIVWHWIT